jgi:hypothetical protein
MAIMSYPKKKSPNPKAKTFAVKNAQNFLSQIKPSERKRVMAVAGFKSITPEGFLKEIEKETKLGRQIIDIHASMLNLDVELFKLHLQEFFYPLTDALKKVEALVAGKSENITKNSETALGESTRNLLFIHPDIPNDTYTTEFSDPAEKLVLEKAQDEQWNISDLSESQATKQGVEAALENNNIDFVLHYDHGNPSALFGWNKEPVIDDTNRNLLSGKVVSSVSCFPAFPALGIGQKAVDSGARAFLGYESLHCYENSFHDCFVNSANAANFALLEGKTFLESYTIGQEVYKTKLQTISESNSDYKAPAYILLLSNSWHFRLLGT